MGKAEVAKLDAMLKGGAGPKKARKIANAIVLQHPNLSGQDFADEARRRSLSQGSSDPEGNVQRYIKRLIGEEQAKGIDLSNVGNLDLGRISTLMIEIKNMSPARPKQPIAVCARRMNLPGWPG